MCGTVGVTRNGVGFSVTGHSSTVVVTSEPGAVGTGNTSGAVVVVTDARLLVSLESVGIVARGNLVKE